MIDPGRVSAVLVTRGDRPLDDILASLTAAGITDIVVWDNSVAEDLSCYGRYAGIVEARNEYILHQDDDLTFPVAELLDTYDPEADRHRIVANNDDGEYWRLTGRGCLFHRDLADCFGPYIAAHGQGAAFHRIADIVFAYRHPYRRVDLGYVDLPWASDPDASMYLEAGHYTVREQAMARVEALEG